MKRILSLVPNVFFLGIVSLLNDASNEMILAVMPAFLVSLGAAPVFIGFLEGFADALSSILKIVSGWFSDRIRRRKVIAVSGYTVSVATRAFLASVGTIWQVFILRAVDRVGKGMREAPRDALLVESVEAHETGKSFGYHRAMDSVGGIVGPLGAVMLLPLLAGNYRSLFWVAFGVGLLAIASFFFVNDRPKGIVRAHTHRRLTFSLKQFGADFKLYLSVLFLFGLGAFPISLMLLNAGAGLTIVQSVPLMYLIYSASFALFAIPSGKLADRWGERRVLVGGFGIAIVAYLVLSFHQSIAAVVLGFALFGAYSAMTDGVMRAYAAKLVPRELLASGQGLVGAAVGISSLLAGIVGGTVWTVWGSPTAFLYGAGMMAVGTIFFLALRGAKGGV